MPGAGDSQSYWSHTLLFPKEDKFHVELKGELLPRLNQGQTAPLTQKQLCFLSPDGQLYSNPPRPMHIHTRTNTQTHTPHESAMSTRLDHRSSDRPTTVIKSPDQTLVCVCVCVCVASISQQEGLWVCPSSGRTVSPFQSHNSSL